MSTLRAIVALPSAMLMILAGPYQAYMYRFGSFGGVGDGLLTWVGVLLAYPVIANRQGLGDRRFLVSWIALAALTYVQMMGRWCSSKTPPDQGRSQAWSGRFEPIMALVMCFMIAAFFGGGPGSSSWSGPWPA